MASIRKRNDSYFIMVSCGYDIHGKQIRRTMTYTPDEGMTERQIEKEVQRQAILFEEKCKTGRVATDGRLKLADFIPMYMETAKQSLSPVVYEKYTHVLNFCIIPMLGHMKLKDIRPVHIQHFVDDLVARDTWFDGQQKKLSNATVRRYYTMLCSLMHAAYKLGLIASNPADRDRITLPKQDEPVTDIFNESEIDAMLNALESEPIQYRVMIHLALNTGCRRGELVGLKWSDINFDTGVMTVSRSNYKLTGDPEVRSKSTKTGRVRRIMLPPYCLEMLRHYRTELYKIR